MSMFASKHKWSLSNTGSDIQFNVEISEWSTSNLTISCCPSLLVNINGVFPTLFLAFKSMYLKFYGLCNVNFLYQILKVDLQTFFGAVSDLLV